MKRAPSRKLVAYLALTAAGSLAGLTLGRPELVALAAPFAAYVAVGLALERRPAIAVSSRLSHERVLEGQEISVTVTVSALTDIAQARLELLPGPGVIPVAAPPSPSARLRAGERREFELKLCAPRWGAWPVGFVGCRARDRGGLVEYEIAPIRLGPVRVFPRAETLRALVGALELQATSGSRVARDRGEGIEFADVRPFVAGDRVRRINWRVTARRGTPYVSERHPERNADVILFLDTFAEARDARGGTLEVAVRAAASLAAGYLARKDRVGVVGFGGVLTGLGPRLGTAQLYRIIDALIGSEVVFSYAHKDVRFVPRRLLPPKALVIAITPLIDRRSIGALLDLRGRGLDLAVLEVSPVPFTAPGQTAAEALAHRLWVLRRSALRARFERLGVAVTEWRDEEPLQLPVALAAEFRRRVRHPMSA
jgi:uncharacterized protein (DUF58 family)